MISPGAKSQGSYLLDLDLTVPRNSLALRLQGRSCCTLDLATNANSSCCLCPAHQSYCLDRGRDATHISMIYSCL